MNALNAVLVTVTSGVLTPFKTLPAQAALLILSAIAGVLAAIAFRFTSNQQALKRVADRMRASLLALLLYREDLSSVFRAQLGLLSASGLRLWHSLPPLLVLMAPFILLLTQLAMWYEFRPSLPGEAVLVTAKIAESAWDQSEFELIPPPAVEVEGFVRDTARREIVWRLRAAPAAAASRPHTLKFSLNGRKIAEKQFFVHGDEASNKLVFVSPRRPGTNFWDRLLYPGEPGFDQSSPIQSIAIQYGARTNTLFGCRVHWLVTFFIASIVAALACKPFVKVQF